VRTVTGVQTCALPILTLTVRTEENMILRQRLGPRLAHLQLRAPCAPGLRARAGSTVFAIPELRARSRETRSESRKTLSTPSLLRSEERRVGKGSRLSW